MQRPNWKQTLVVLALGLFVGVGTSPSAADDERAPAVPAPGQKPEASPPNAGDTRKIDFVLPFEKALQKAREEKRLLFVKPIYGGVDQQGAEDYRCGSW